MLTKAIITEPATVAMPVVININNSFFDRSFRYGLINKGAST